MTGIAAISAERKRQIKQEGFNADHDAQHTDGTLAVVAAALAIDGTAAFVCDPFDRGSPEGLEGDCWGLIYKHRPTRLRQLAIAGALIAAEYDRIAADQKGHPSV